MPKRIAPGDLVVLWRRLSKLSPWDEKLLFPRLPDRLNLGPTPSEQAIHAFLQRDKPMLVIGVLDYENSLGCTCRLVVLDGFFWWVPSELVTAA